MQQVWKSAQLKDVVVEMSYVDLDALLAAIGEHHVSAKTVAQRIARSLRSGDEPAQMPATVDRPRRERREGEPHARSVCTSKVSTTCSSTWRVAARPCRATAIIGFVTRGRGVSVHRSDCAQRRVAHGRAGDPDDRGRVGRPGQTGATFVAGVEVVALDRSRLLRDVANALVDHHVNIVSCQTITGADRVAKMRFEFELANPGHLEAVVRTIKGIDGVYDAYRLVPGAAVPVA